MSPAHSLTTLLSSPDKSLQPRFSLVETKTKREQNCQAKGKSYVGRMAKALSAVWQKQCARRVVLGFFTVKAKQESEAIQTKQKQKK